eukprot:evm.model.scf_1900.1 EVM.evm.TU.scf_1900.1   scf_1900:7818-8769(+)
MSSRNFQWAIVAHMVLGLLTSLWQPDVTVSIAALGFVALFISNVQLLWLYVAFAPLTCFLDIGQMYQANHHNGTKVFGFFVFLRLLEMIAKVGGGWFGYQIYQSATAAEAGYETMRDPEPHADHFPPPTSYAAPGQPESGPQDKSGQPGLSPGV